MRLCFVVQRYGAEVAGGAEQFCREFATRMAGRGHEVDVATSAAISYLDWADHYGLGTSMVGPVRVHRLGVRHPRDHRVFGALNARVVYGSGRVPLHLQREWMRAQGPDLPGLVPWLEAHAAGYDVVVFFTYLYQTTFTGLPVASRLAPTLLHPTAHDEPPLYLSIFDYMFRQAHAFGFLTEEEQALVRRRFGLVRPSSVVGIGVDLAPCEGVAPARRGGPDPEEVAFRAAYGLGERPYLLYMGRVDPHKGSEELFGFYLAYRRRHLGARSSEELALVVLGEAVKPLPFYPDVVMTGFVDDGRRRGALAGALALVVPSPFESFSMALTEAWAARTPALVQAASEVLVGQAVRSQGAIPYSGFAEFEAAVEALVASPELASALGRAGRRYVEGRYSWDAVLGRYERQLEMLAARRWWWRPSTGA
ncbi:MAG: glycosyltransferase family 4 protein [Acidimicrobiales bacterium]